MQDPIDPGDLARLQQAVLAAALGANPLEPGGDPVGLPDLQFATRDEAVALSSDNLAPGVALDALPRPAKLITPAVAPEAGTAAATSRPAPAGYLEFKPPVIDGDLLTLGLQVFDFPPGSTRAVPISTLSLQYRRRGDEWVLDAPPAALSS